MRGVIDIILFNTNNYLESNTYFTLKYRYHYITYQQVFAGLAVSNLKLFILYINEFNNA